MQEDERLSLREAADALGVSEVTARRWIKSGKLKAHQPGRKYLIPRSAVDELLESESPKAPSRSSLEPKLFNGIQGERREYDFQAARDGLDRFCAYWEQRLADGRISRQEFEDVGAAAEAWMPILATAATAELNEIIESGRRSPHPELYGTGSELLSLSEIYKAGDRYLRLGESLAQAEHEMYGNDAEAERRRKTFTVLRRIA